MDIDEANRRLRAAQIRVSIRARGNKLSLRATLPPKPSSTKLGDYQQDISLGVSANDAGLKLAIAEAKKLGVLLDSRKFDWQDYLGTAKPNNLKQTLEDFEEAYFRNTPRTLTTEYTYRKEYQAVFKRLTQISESAMLALIETKTPATRVRKRYGDALGKLANFVGMDGTKIRAMGRGYNRSQLNPRTIPTEAEVVEVGESLPDDLRWGYWAIAAYGLRPHEIYLLDFEEFPMTYVGRGKTNERVTFPFPPQWAEAIPKDGAPPPTICKGNAARGERITHAYRKHLPFNLYALRHAWAIRTIDYGLDISLAAQQMGHSVKVHSEIYHHWITKEIHLKAWQRLTAQQP